MQETLSSQQILQADYNHSRDVAGMSHEEFVRMRGVSSQEASILRSRYHIIPPQPLPYRQVAPAPRFVYYHRK